MAAVGSKAKFCHAPKCSGKLSLTEPKNLRHRKFAIWSTDLIPLQTWLPHHLPLPLPQNRHHYLNHHHHYCHHHYRHHHHHLCLHLLFLLLPTFLLLLPLLLFFFLVPVPLPVFLALPVYLIRSENVKSVNWPWRKHPFKTSIIGQIHRS